MANQTNHRRSFLGRLMAASGLSAAGAPASQAQGSGVDREYRFLPKYARAQDYKSLKQSSYDVTGGNRDAWPIPAGEVREVFKASGPGVITHIWFTIAARSANHL